MKPEAGTGDENGSESEPEGTGAGTVSGKASVVEIQETLLAENLPEGIHILGESGSME